MDLKFIDEATLRRLVSVERAVETLEVLFSHGLPDLPPRQHLDTGNGDLLLMPAWDASSAGVKLVTVAPDNPGRGLPLIDGVYVLFDGETMQPKGVIDAAALTGLRTAAVSAVATKHLARTDARHVVVFGGGVQARWHIEAMLAVRSVDHVTVVTRSASSAQTVVDEFGDRIACTVGEPGAVADADIVCCCTTSAEPLFDGDLLKPGAHVNAVGSYKPVARELDDTVMSRGDVVVELRSTVLSEAGDLRIPIEAGVISATDVVELSDVLGGRGGRYSDTAITVFKSVGHASEDLAVAVLAFG